MRKLLIIICVLFLFCCSQLIQTKPAHALERIDNGAKLILTSNKTSALADGKDEITFTFGHFYPDVNEPHAYVPNCQTEDYIGAGTQLRYPPTMDMYGYSPGSSIYINGKSSNDHITAFGGPGLYMIDVISCETGYTTFRATSTSAGQKTIGVRILDGQDNNLHEPIVLSVQFVDSSSAPTTKPKSATTTSVPTKPTLTLNSKTKVTTTNQNITLDISNQLPVISTNQKLTLAGTTTAGAKVTLTIKSDPITKEVTAGADGKWTYTLDPKELALETGTHTVTAIATDTKGVASDSIELAKFELKDISANSSNPTQPYHWSWRELLTTLNYIFAGGILLLLAGLIFLIIRRRKLNKVSLVSQNPASSNLI